MTKYTHSDAHVFWAYEGDALHLLCLACGATETVPEYGQGENPTHFLFKPKLPYGWTQMRCHRCGEHSERRLPFSDLDAKLR